MEQNKKSNLQIIKNNNKNMILRIIHENSHLSRAKIKRITGLAPTTVSTLVDELIEDGIVKETGVLDTSGAGRKAISVEINPIGMYFAGVEVDSERVAVGIYDLGFCEVFYKESDVGTYDEIFNFIVDTIKQERLLYDIKAISIGVSGIIDTKNKKILLSTVLDISDGDIIKSIEKEFSDIDVMLLNSSGLIAYAEADKRRVKDLISVDIGKGVGSGIIINDMIYTGKGGTAGELGHITVDMNGELCKCGNKGCTELYTNTRVIRKRAAKILNEENVSLKRVKEELDKGNSEIKNLIYEIADIFSYALAGLINMMAPEIVVIGGQIKELKEEFLIPLKSLIEKKCHLRQTKIEYSSVEGNAVTLGGAKYAFKKNIINL